MVASGVANPLEGIGFGAAVDYLGLEVGRSSGYGGRTCTGRWTLPGVMVMPLVGPAKFMQILTLKMARRSEGGDGFSGVRKGAR